MKQRKLKLVILALVALLLMASSIALILYSKNRAYAKMKPHKEYVAIYIATKDIPRGAKIDASMIAKKSYPVGYIQNPLTKEEIVGHYAVDTIFQKEPFRYGKLSSSPIAKQSQKQKPLKPNVTNSFDNNISSDLLTLPLDLFANIDPTLKRLDYIDIVSIKPKRSQQSREYSFSMRYVAIGLKIHSFLSGGKRINSYLNKSSNQTLVADSIVLKVNSQAVKNLLLAYYPSQLLNERRVYNKKQDYRGHLWMIKSSKKVSKSEMKQKQKMLLNYKPKIKKRSYRAKKKAAKPKVSIDYEK